MGFLGNFGEMFRKEKEEPIVEDETLEEAPKPNVEAPEADSEVPAVETEGENPNENVPGSVE